MLFSLIVIVILFGDYTRGKNDFDVEPKATWNSDPKIAGYYSLD